MKLSYFGGLGVKTTACLGLVFASAMFGRSQDASSSTIIVRGGNTRHQCDVPRTVTNPLQISAGAFHTMALQPDGTVVAWGKNHNFQTNVPTFYPWGNPNQTEQDTNFIAVAAGGDHCAGLRNDGTVVLWGSDWDGQVTGTPRACTNRQALALSSHKNVIAVAAGWAHTVVLKKDGSVVSWGNNFYGQTNTPSVLNDVIAIACGYYHTLALRSDHTVISWGSMDYVPPEATNVIAIAAGWEHSLALRADGTIVAWGDGSYGQTIIPASATNVVAISAGYGRDIALKADGTVVVWGRKLLGVKVDTDSLTNVVAISCGEEHDVFVIGNGAPRFTTQPVSTDTGVGQQAFFTASASGAYPLSYQWLYAGNPIVGETNRYLLLNNRQPNDGGTYAVEVSNSFGKVRSTAAILKVNAKPFVITTPSQRIVPLHGTIDLAVNLVGASPISARWYLNGSELSDNEHVTGTASNRLHINSANLEDTGNYTVIAKNGYGVTTQLVSHVTVTTVIAWGDNSLGQLDTPDQLHSVVDVAAYYGHCLALDAEGTALSWGYTTYSSMQWVVPAFATNLIAIAHGANCFGLRQDGSTVVWDSWGPKIAPTLPKIIALAGTGGTPLALTIDGRVVLDENVPTSATNVVAIASGVARLALRADGTVVGWSSSSERLAPDSLTNIVAVWAGNSACTALRTDGLMFQWQVSGAIASEPRIIATNAIAAFPGKNHTLILNADRTVSAFGADDYGQADVPDYATNVLKIIAGDFFSLAIVDSGTPIKTNLISERVGNKIILASKLQGFLPGSCKWLHDGVEIPGANSPWLVISNLQMPDGGNYEFQFLDGLKRNNTEMFDVIAQGKPLIATAVSTQTVLVGTTQTIAAEVSGAAPMSCRWFRGGTLLTNDQHITGADLSQLSLVTTKFADIGDYYLVVSNSYGVVTQYMAHVSVTPVSVWGEFDQSIVPSSATNVIALGTERTVVRSDGTLLTSDPNASGWAHSPQTASGLIAMSQLVGLRFDGTVWEAGNSIIQGAPADLTNAIAISASDSHCLALRADGTVVAWGDAGVPGYNRLIVPPSATNIISITATAVGSVALRNDGVLIVWGLDNGYSLKPESATNLVAIAAGEHHVLGLRRDGTVVAWGYNSAGETTVPDGLTNVVSIAAGTRHSVALKADGTVVAWGDNSYGQTNVPATTRNVVAIAARNNESMALLGSEDSVPLQGFALTNKAGRSLVFPTPLQNQAGSSFQWLLNSVPLPNATNASLSLANLRWTNSGIYQLVVSNQFRVTYGPEVNLTIPRSQLRFEIPKPATSKTWTVTDCSGVGIVRIQNSTNLTKWNDVLTNVSPLGTLEFTVSTNNAAEFYRAIEE